MLFHLYFAIFFRKYHFLSYFLSWAPPPEKLKSKKKKKKKKKRFQILTNSWTRACVGVLLNNQPIGDCYTDVHHRHTYIIVFVLIIFRWVDNPVCYY